MKCSWKHIIAIAPLAIGCASVPQAPTAKVTQPAVISAESQVHEVDFQEPLTPKLAQPEAIDKAPQPLPSPAEEPLQPAVSLSLVEQLAIANNPTVSQAQARLRALHGKWLQVGLPPNPTIGYMAAEVGANGDAGQQGGFVGQEFVRGKKLQRNRAIVCAEIEKAEQQLATILRRVQTDVRQRYYSALLAQRRVKLADELVKIAQGSVETSKKLLEAQEIPLKGLLQSEIQLQNALLLSRTSRNQLNQTWRQLQALLGEELLAQQELEGDVSALPVELDFEEQLAQLQSSSPEIATAIAEVTRSRRALNRACVEAVPNITAQVSVQQDVTNDETLTGVQIGIPLPLWNRNQGGICQARAEVSQAMRNVDRVERNLQQRLAASFRQYTDARITAETYTQEILTRSKQNLDLVLKGYPEQVSDLDLLTAQRMYFQTNLDYLDSLENLWRSYLRIEGLLLEDSLAAELQ